MTLPHRPIIAACLAALLLVPAAHAELKSRLAITKPRAHPTEVTVTAGAWMPRLGGDVDLGQRMSLQDDLDLRDMEPTFNAELSIRKHDFFELHMTGFTFSTDSTGEMPRARQFGDLDFVAGDPFRSSFDFTSVSAELRFWLFQPYASTRDAIYDDGRRRLRFRLAPHVGVRYVDVDHTLEHIGIGREDAGGEWVGLFGGGSFKLMFRPETSTMFFDRLVLEAGGSGGPVLGGDGGFMWQVQAGLRIYCNEHLGIIIGYRLVELNVRNDDYKLVGGLQGLFLGGTLQF